MLLATFKHISSKNADYSAAEAYLTFEHDEFTMKPTLDENGRLIPRRNYHISTLNCGDEDFAIACLRANLRYGKNQKREDVKSHHYIISFDPKDVPDHGLTVDRAQQLGEEFCRNHFPGHQAIVCTHPDGHNGSGNVHVHIVINSLRIMEISFMPHMDRPCDTQPGMKHRCTNAAMEYFRAEVMEMCHDAGLYQIDLLNGSKTRVTEREYWAKKKGQLALDEENAELAEQGYVRRRAGKKNQKQPALSAPLKFKTSDGFTVLVGRNNRQNDKLTMKDANNNDIWFHTKNIPGSHTVLVTDGKAPTETAMEEAAVLAAQHSRAKDSAQVPVDYTQIRYVSKPQGAKPGMVIYVSYQTAYVTPDLELEKRLLVE